MSTDVHPIVDITVAKPTPEAAPAAPGDTLHTKLLAAFKAYATTVNEKGTSLFDLAYETIIAPCTTCGETGLEIFYVRLDGTKTAADAWVSNSGSTTCEHVSDSSEAPIIVLSEDEELRDELQRKVNTEFPAQDGTSAAAPAATSSETTTTEE